MFLATIVGSTGSGKSALALCLAQQFSGEIAALASRLESEQGEWKAISADVGAKMQDARRRFRSAVTSMQGKSAVTLGSTSDNVEV